MKLSGTYSVSNWDESLIRPDEDGRRASKASVELLFIGDIEAQAFVEYLMFYKTFDEKEMHNSQASYVGQIKIVGLVKGKAGSFILTDSGSFKAGIASSDVEIIPNSGTGELASITGSGTYEADATGCRWELDLQF